MHSEETIVALATPRGKSALAILRVSGSRAHGIIAACIETPEKFYTSPSGKIRLYTFVDPHKQEIVDQVTAIKYTTPKSFTGENMVEIICHGGLVVIDRIAECLLWCGARYAKKGDFTRRAFLNGKLNLLKAEAINAVIESTNERQQKNALQGYLGGNDSELIQLKRAINEILIDVEAEIEFGDEDSVKERQNSETIKKRIECVKNEIKTQLHKREKLKIIEQGVTAAIVGVPNSGKSTLFNLILDYERSLVHEKKGTTRDFVSEMVSLEGMYLKIIDTAGIVKTEDVVERMGIEKSWKLVETAHIVILVTSAVETDCAFEEEIIRRRGGKPVIAIVSKTDNGDGKEKKELLGKKNISFNATCLLDQKWRKQTISFLTEKIRNIHDGFSEECFLINERQEETAKKIFCEIEEMEKNGYFHLEIVSSHLRAMLEYVEEFVGEVTREEILDTIFNNFCIGK